MRGRAPEVKPARGGEPPRRVALVDPASQVPGYDRWLCESLARLGLDVDLHASPLLHYALEPSSAGGLEHSFGRLLGPPGRPRRRMSRHPHLRRLLRALGYPLELLTFVRQLPHRGVDLVHFQWSPFPALDAAAYRALRRRGLPVIHTVHNHLPHEARPGQAAAYRRLYRAADRLILHTEASRAAMERALGPIDRPCELVAMPADPVRPAADGDRPAARRRLGLDEASPLLLFFGHARPYKGLDLLLAVWPELRRRQPDARLLVAGPVAGGRRGLATLRPAVDAAAAAGGLDWRPGFVSQARVADHFAAADLVLLPYRDSDHSAVLTAARGYGRAVLATAVGGLPEALAAGGGRLIPHGDPAALAGEAAALLADPDCLRALEREAREAARAWTWEDAARATLAVYLRALRARADR